MGMKECTSIIDGLKLIYFTKVGSCHFRLLANLNDPIDEDYYLV